MVYKHRDTKPLAWYEINDNDITTCCKAGISIDNYVADYVLPNIERIKQENIEKFGINILTK